jgi:hypothetical protein
MCKGVVSGKTALVGSLLLLLLLPEIAVQECNASTGIIPKLVKQMVNHNR